MISSENYLYIGIPLSVLLILLIIYLTLYYKKFIKNEKFSETITNGPSNNSEQFPAYVICLSEKLYQTALKNINLPNLQKFDAIKGSTLDPNKIDMTISAKRSIFVDVIRENHRDFGSMNAIGCALSHMTLWQKVIDENLEGMYIFESDAVCNTQDFQQYVDLFLKEEDPHMIFFGLLGRPVGITEKISKIPGRFYGLHGYMITKNGAKRCLQYAKPLEQQIDSYLSDLNILSNDVNNKLNLEPLNLYVVNEFKCFQRNLEGTTIQTKSVKGG